MRNQLSSYENFSKLIKTYWKFSGAQLRSRHKRTSGARSCATLLASLSQFPGVSASPSRESEGERETCSVDVTTATAAITKSTSEATAKFWEFRRSRSWHPIRFDRGVVHIGKSSDFSIWKKMKKSQSICLHVSLVEIVISFLSSNNNSNKMYTSRTGKRLRRMSVSLVKKTTYLKFLQLRKFFIVLHQLLIVAAVIINVNCIKNTSQLKIQLSS